MSNTVSNLKQAVSSRSQPAAASDGREFTPVGLRQQTHSLLDSVVAQHPPYEIPSEMDWAQLQMIDGVTMKRPG